MITIDGSRGEGGGQILRTALALALCRRRAVRVVRIRAHRDRSGLRPQHLAAVRAAADVSRGRVEGAAIDSQEIVFEPGAVEPGGYRFAMGTAGSTSLVLQTVLPALITAAGPSVLRLEGGTHNPRAPTFDYLARAFLPVLARMGPRVGVELERAGFEPAGGGVVNVRIEPSPCLEPLHLETRGALHGLEAEILLSKLPRHIADREAAVLAGGLELDDGSIRIRVVEDSPGPGNVVSVFVTSERITEVFTGFGRRGVPAERVAGGVVEDVRRYLAARAPVGRHLADQLVLPLALAGSGRLVTMPPSGHTQTSIAVIRQFLGLEIRCVETSEAETWRIELGAAARAPRPRHG